MHEKVKTLFQNNPRLVEVLITKGSNSFVGLLEEDIDQAKVKISPSDELGITSEEDFKGMLNAIQKELCIEQFPPSTSLDLKEMNCTISLLLTPTCMRITYRKYKHIA